LFGGFNAAPEIRVKTGRLQVAGMYCGRSKRSRYGPIRTPPVRLIFGINFRTFGWQAFGWQAFGWQEW
jgi:hypothetical protein